MSVLEQGDLIRVDFNPTVGHEPAKTRPALVVTGYGFNSRSSLVGVAPIQTKDSGYPLHVEVVADGVHGWACIEKVRNIDVEARGYELIGYADDATMGRVMGLIRGMYDLR